MKISTYFPKTSWLGAIALLLWPHFSMASEAAVLKEAQDLTRKLLTDPQTRAREGLNTPDAQAAHQRVLELTGANGAQTEAIYGISADVFQNLTTETNGDPAAIANALANAQKDPKAFFQTLTPEQQAKIRALASEIDQKKVKAP